MSKNPEILRMGAFSKLHSTNRENIYRAIRVGQFDKRFPEWMLIDSGTLERREYLFQKKTSIKKVSGEVRVYRVK